MKKLFEKKTPTTSRKAETQKLKSNMPKAPEQPVKDKDDLSQFFVSGPK